MKSLVPIKEIENEKIISQHALQRCDFYTISNFFYVIDRLWRVFKRDMPVARLEVKRKICLICISLL